MITKTKEDLQIEINRLKKEKEEKQEIEKLEKELKELKKNEPKPIWLIILLSIGSFFLLFGKFMVKLFMNIGKKFDEKDKKNGRKNPKNNK